MHGQREMAQEGERAESEMSWKKEQDEKGNRIGYWSRPSRVEIDLGEPIQTRGDLLCSDRHAAPALDPALLQARVPGYPPYI